MVMKLMFGSGVFFGEGKGGKKKYGKKPCYLPAHLSTLALQILQMWDTASIHFTSTGQVCLARAPKGERLCREPH